MLNGQVFSDQLFESHIFALFINTFVDGHNGIAQNYKNGMAVTYSGSNVSVDTGAVLIQGRYLEEDAGTTIDAGTNTLFCKLVITINLDLVNTESVFNQGKYEIITDSSDYPILTQQDIVNTNSGTYQYELAQFKTGSSGITNFVDKRTFLDISGLYTALETQYATRLNQVEADIGTLANLSTTDKSDLVAALNEIFGMANVQTDYIGDVQGRYIKFGNGVMICYNKRTMQIPIRTAQDGLYYGDKNLGNLPATFTSTPVVLGMASGDSHGWVERIYGSTTTFWGNMRVLRTSQTDSSGYSTSYTYVAIGFWK